MIVHLQSIIIKVRSSEYILLQNVYRWDIAKMSGRGNSRCSKSYPII